MIPRLFTSLPLLAGASIPLDPAAAHHVRRVLRLGAGDPVELFDGDGGGATATLLDTPAGSARVDALLPTEPPPPLQLTLAQCISAADKMDWTIEKAVELGVSAIVPLQSQKAIVRLTEARGSKRREHWLRLIIAACGQSGRNRAPRLEPVAALSDWIRTGNHRADGVPVLRIILAPCAARSLNAVLAEHEPGFEIGNQPRGQREVWLLCGPESGFSEPEFRQAVDAGWLPAALGPRVLRTETAGLAALAVLQARWGDLR
jgi:16S rRNA (uracil1498-N3)-methyltransferase